MILDLLRAIFASNEPPLPPRRGFLDPEALIDVAKTPPSISALDQYLEAVRDRHAHLALKGLSAGNIPPIPIESVYVSLRAVPGELSEDAANSLTESRQNGFQESAAVSTFLDATYYRSENQQEQPSDVEALLAEHPRLAILGEPGSGKTTFLEALCGRIIQRPEEIRQRLNLTEKPIPIFVQLRQVNPKDLPSIDRFAEVCLSNITRSEVPSTLLADLIRAGRCVVMFDGMDEISDLTRRGAVRDWIEEFSSNYQTPQRPNRIIVTSRVHGYRETPLSRGFRQFRLCRFDFNDVRRFVRQWQSMVTPQGRSPESRSAQIETTTERLLNIFQAKRSILQLASNPLLLTIVLLVYNNRASLPEERRKLYAECLDVMLEHLQRARQEDSHAGTFDAGLNMKLERQLDLLRGIAFWLHDRGLREVPAETLADEVLRERLPPIGHDPDEGLPFLEAVERRSGLLIRRGADTGFAHQGFQEYLTALELSERRQTGEVLDYLVSRRFQSWWREVILLYAGLVPDAGPIIERLLSEKEHEWGLQWSHHNLLLAGSCLADSRAVVRTELRGQIIAQLVDVFSNPPYPFHRRQALSALVSIGGREVIRAFEELLTTSDDVLCCSEAVQGLCMMGNRVDVRPRLNEVSKSQTYPSHSRIAAIRGLASAGPATDETEQFLTDLLFSNESKDIRQEAVTTLGATGPRRALQDKVWNDILNSNRHASELDGVFVAAAKAFAPYYDARKFLSVVQGKLVLAGFEEFKVELCRSLTRSKSDSADTQSCLRQLVQTGRDWGARGGAALALGLSTEDRRATGYFLASCLGSEKEIGVRLRIATALAFLGCQEQPILQALKQMLDTEVQPTARSGAIEAYALLSRDGEFISRELEQPVLRTDQLPRIRSRALSILRRLDHYTEPFVISLVARLDNLDDESALDAIQYLQNSPVMPLGVRATFEGWLKNTVSKGEAQISLRSTAYEALFISLGAGQ